MFILHTPHSAFGIGNVCLELPVLCRARLAKNIEGADANKGFHFLGERLDAAGKIGEGREFAALALVQDSFLGAVGKSFDEKNRDTNCGRRRQETLIYFCFRSSAFSLLEQSLLASTSTSYHELRAGFI